MPKMKTVKSVKDRFKVTGTGKLMRYKPGRRHLLAGKPSKLMRHLRKQAGIGSAAEERKIKSLLPYS